MRRFQAWAKLIQENKSGEKHGSLAGHKNHRFSKAATAAATVTVLQQAAPTLTMTPCENALHALEGSGHKLLHSLRVQPDLGTAK